MIDFVDPPAQLPELNLGIVGFLQTAGWGVNGCMKGDRMRMGEILERGVWGGHGHLGMVAMSSKTHVHQVPGHWAPSALDGLISHLRSF